MRQLKRQDRTPDVLPEHVKKKTAKTKDKVETKLVQTENKVSTELRTQPRTKLVQTENKVSTKNELKTQTENKVSTELRTQPRTKLVQTENKVSTIASFSSLIGLQKKLLLLIYFSIRKNQSNSSEPLTVEFLAESSQSTRYSVRQSIQRLEKKGVVVREQFKNGRGGWTIYSLPKSVFQDLLQNETENKVSTNLVQTENKVSTELSTQLSTTPSSSSSVQKNKSTTTSDELWKTLDLSSVEKMGINQSAIFEARQKFGPFDFIDFETFLERFSKYMSDSSKSRGIGNARGFFFSLCKQIGEGIEPLSEVQTASDEALENLLRTRKEQKREREEMERELMLFEFDEWFEKLSSVERDEISPSSDLLRPGTEPYRAVFRGYFEKNLWPQVREEVVGRSYA